MEEYQEGSDYIAKLDWLNNDTAELELRLPKKGRPLDDYPTRIEQLDMDTAHIDAHKK